LLTILLSGVCGGISYVFFPSDVFARVFIAYIAMNLLVRIPVMILLTSIVCVIPVLPPWVHMSPNILGDVDSQPSASHALMTCLKKSLILIPVFPLRNGTLVVLAFFGKEIYGYCGI
jgi:hypothetical protein